MSGPLAGLRVIELRGIGPAPYAGMLLADMGAEVVVVERATRPGGLSPPAAHDATMRSKASIALNLKHRDGVAALLDLLPDCDVLFEGFRPGVAESLGIGPDTCLARNERLVYGRLTGWGQDGPLRDTAGHDINYIALTGALAAIGPAERPVPPLNLVGDYAGGSLFLVMGILAAYIEAQRSGRGQVIDAAMTDGSASLMTLFHTLQGLGAWQTERASNLLDGGAHQYGVYETSDGQFVAIGCLEPRFQAEFLTRAGLDPAQFGDSLASRDSKAQCSAVAALMKTRTRDEWCALFDGSDACVTPVLTIDEAPTHPHHRARGTYIRVGGLLQPAPAPRFSRTPSSAPRPPRTEGADTADVLRRFGFSSERIAALRASGAIPD